MPRHSMRALIVAAGALLAVACDGRRNDSPQPGCVDAAAIELDVAQSEPWLSDNTPLVSVQFTARPVSAAASPEQRYWLDPEGDGVFEFQFSPPSTVVNFTAPGRYPAQVTAVSCQDHRVLVGRYEIELRWKPRPFPGARFVPDVSAAELLVNSSVTVIFEPQGDLEALPWRLQWSRGDGSPPVTRVIEKLADADTILDTWSFPEPGLFEFSATLTDADGVSAEQRVPILVTRRTAPVVRLSYGQAFRDQGLIAASASGMTIAVGGGPDGVVFYDGPATGLTPVARLLLEPEGTRFADAVKVDPVRRIVYVSTGSDGLYAVDVTDVAAPAVFRPPAPILPPAAVNVLIAAHALCDGGRRLFYANAGDAVYAATLDDAVLAWRRTFPTSTSSPWQPTRQAETATGAPLRISVPDARVLHCPDDGLLVVGRQGRADVYDYSAFLTGGAVRMVTSVVPPVVERTDAIYDIASVPAANPPGAIELELANGDNGWSEFLLDPASGSTTLTKHFYAVHRSTSGFSSAGDLRDQIVAIDRRGNWLVAGGFNGGAHDSVYVFRHMDWPSATTRYYAYEGDHKCSSASLAGDAGGDAFPDMAGCLVGLHPARIDGFAGDASRVVIEEQAGLRELALPTTVSSLSALPSVLGAADIRAPHLWASVGKTLFAYALSDLAAGAASGLQPAPAVTIELPIASVGLLAPSQTTALVLFDTDQILFGRWPGSNALTDLRTVTIDGGISLAAALDDGSYLAVRDRLAGQVTYLRVDAAALTSVSSSQGGYARVHGCGATFVRWKQDAGTLLIERTTGSGNVAGVWGLPASSFVATACDEGGIFLLQAVEGGFSVSRLINGDSSSVWSLALPWSTQNVVATQLVRQGVLLGVQVTGEPGGGLLVYDLSAGEPRLLAADLAGGRYRPLLLDATLLYYGGSVIENGFPALYLRQIQ